ncbi:hypothetical protein PIIN_09866 [Serendipita indica DSM 11827]|uniref:Uncharacterized protein n=1 Tax=Serendipita indica (strain DSM 11827) TaxID=1109443 RepID=G4TX27_SERID|nr:hypothetical protein PIIN_09866 [Serendipita indica DSM 11827]
MTCRVPRLTLSLRPRHFDSHEPVSPFYLFLTNDLFWSILLSPYMLMESALLNVLGALGHWTRSTRVQGIAVVDCGTFWQCR